MRSMGAARSDEGQLSTRSGLPVSMQAAPVFAAGKTEGDPGWIKGIVYFRDSDSCTGHGLNIPAIILASSSAW